MDERWWCEGEDCNGDHRKPHVHVPNWGGRAGPRANSVVVTIFVDPATGLAVDADHG